MKETRIAEAGRVQPFGWPAQEVDMEKAAEKAVDSFGQAGQLLTETTLALFRKQAQLMTGSVDSMMAGVRDCQRARSPYELLARETDVVRRNLEAATSGMRDITDIFRRCGYEMMDLWLTALPHERHVERSPGKKAAE